MAFKSTVNRAPNSWQKPLSILTLKRDWPSLTWSGNSNAKWRELLDCNKEIPKKLETKISPWPGYLSMRLISKTRDWENNGKLYRTTMKYQKMRQKSPFQNSESPRTTSENISRRTATKWIKKSAAKYSRNAIGRETPKASRDTKRRAKRET